MSKVSSNTNKIINELKKRGVDFFPLGENNLPNESTKFVLSWDMEYKYVYVKVTKNRIVAHSVSTETNMCIWYWQLWLSKRIVNQVCDWITSEVWGD